MAIWRGLTSSSPWPKAVSASAFGSGSVDSFTDQLALAGGQIDRQLRPEPERAGIPLKLVSPKFEADLGVNDIERPHQTFTHCPLIDRIVGAVILDQDPAVDL